MCLDAIYGSTTETLEISCSVYNHGWVRSTGMRTTRRRSLCGLRDTITHENGEPAAVTTQHFDTHSDASASEWYRRDPAD
jgi:hypothetical protein